MSARMRRSLIVAILHLAIVASLGGKLLFDRATRPRVWARAAPFDPALPIRGRYVRLLLSTSDDDHVLALARAQADFVLVDTPPAGALADAALLAPRLEGMLLVVSAGRTKRDLARRAREQLERVNANLLGVVLTDVREDDKLYKY